MVDLNKSDFSKGIAPGALLEELCQRYPLQGVGPLAWLDVATSHAHKTGQSLVEVVNRWCVLSDLAKLSVTFDVGAELTIIELDV